MLSRLRRERGSVAVETAITLPLVLLLTLGGISVLWWLYNKLWLHVIVSETARERAADATWTGYYKDIRDSLQPPRQSFGLPDVRLLSFHLPTDPPFIAAGACTAAAGHVPTLPMTGGDRTSAVLPRPDQGGWLQLVREVRWELERLLAGAREFEEELDEFAEAGVATAEQLIWYRRAVENLMDESAFRRRQAIDYLAGALIEEAMVLPCQNDEPGGAILPAKAVIQGERTFPQR